MRLCACGQTVGDIRLADGSRQAVDPWPIPYRMSEQGSLRLITKEGLAVTASGCRPDGRHGVGYLPHRCAAARDD